MYRNNIRTLDPMKQTGSEPSTERQQHQHTYDQEREQYPVDAFNASNEDPLAPAHDWKDSETPKQFNKNLFGHDTRETNMPGSFQNYEEEESGNERTGFSTTKPVQHDLRNEDSNYKLSSSATEQETGRRRSLTEKLKNAMGLGLNKDQKHTHEDTIIPHKPDITEIGKIEAEETSKSQAINVNKNESDRGVLGNATIGASNLEKGTGFKEQQKHPITEGKTKFGVYNPTPPIPETKNVQEKKTGIPGCGVAKGKTESHYTPTETSTDTRRRLSESDMYATNIPPGLTKTDDTGFENTENVHIPGTAMPSNDFKEHHHHHHHHQHNHHEKDVSGTGAVRYPSEQKPSTVSQYSHTEQANTANLGTVGLTEDAARGANISHNPEQITNEAQERISNSKVYGPLGESYVESHPAATTNKANASPDKPIETSAETRRRLSETKMFGTAIPTEDTSYSKFESSQKKTSMENTKRVTSDRQFATSTIAGVSPTGRRPYTTADVERQNAMEKRLRDPNQKTTGDNGINNFDWEYDHNHEERNKDRHTKSKSSIPVYFPGNCFDWRLDTDAFRKNEDLTTRSETNKAHIPGNNFDWVGESITTKGDKGMIASELEGYGPGHASDRRVVVGSQQPHSETRTKEMMKARDIPTMDTDKVEGFSYHNVEPIRTDVNEGAASSFDYDKSKEFQQSQRNTSEGIDKDSAYSSNKSTGIAGGISAGIAAIGGVLNMSSTKTKGSHEQDQNEGMDKRFNYEITKDIPTEVGKVGTSDVSQAIPGSYAADVDNSQLTAPLLRKEAKEEPTYFDDDIGTYNDIDGVNKQVNNGLPKFATSSSNGAQVSTIKSEPQHRPNTEVHNKKSINTYEWAPNDNAPSNVASNGFSRNQYEGESIADTQRTIFEGQGVHDNDSRYSSPRAESSGQQQPLLESKGRGTGMDKMKREQFTRSEPPETQQTATGHTANDGGAYNLGSSGAGIYSQTIGNSPSLVDPSKPTYGFKEGQAANATSYTTTAPSGDATRKKSFGSTTSSGAYSSGEERFGTETTTASRKDAVPRSQQRRRSSDVAADNTRRDSKGGFLRRVSVGIMNQLPKPKM
ncbi:hypothetical protein NCAS_0D00300 [Naumovozyma castellii]|uniref:Uncharacterized protein n=1 Tax=Naumovozyma castellii TaxID=27288 RepID=G0VEZ2_NAUCA|nr:hypothetical protein NCAS_0D00300 [Naumovozyma castellii CBS 4309]CCC69611.1 hypothetical protein NCAS_0D00300 [Naumovozyma castellii CBS 4309]